MEQTVLELDIETRSDVDLQKGGVYRYAQSDAFEILLLGYSLCGAPVRVIDLARGERIPADILSMLADRDTVKIAHNAAFERICLSAWLRKHEPEIFETGRYRTDEPVLRDYLDPVSWRCSMVMCAYNGLPLSLEMAGQVLNLDEQKMGAGRELIRFFCSPDREGKRNRPSDAPEKWELFKAYNARDVEVERAIVEKLRRFPVPESVWAEYHMGETINDRGIRIDRDMVRSAVDMDDRARRKVMAKMSEATDLDNPASVPRMKEWLRRRGVETGTLNKKDVDRLLETVPEDTAEVLRMRRQIAKSSCAKYQAMEASVCRDGRCRGMFMFYGGSRTGRFAGRKIQLQNLPQNHIPDLAEARALVKARDFEMLEMLYGNVPSVLSELIRTAFIPAEGRRFIVCDYSAIEARVIAFLAGETWRNEVFRNNGDIYCASAGAMFHVNVVKGGENGHLRQKGKIAELALGYGGSEGALKAMGALEMGLKEAELKPLVTAWRAANPHIVKFWWDVDRAVKAAIRTRMPTRVGKIRFEVKAGMLWITLPSGRRLTYVRPEIGINRFGGESVTYMGLDEKKKWARVESYGPKFVENIVQGVARDLLCAALRELEGFRIVGHVHDEVIVECEETVTIQDIAERMSKTPAWAEGLLLRAEGYMCEWYRKE